MSRKKKRVDDLGLELPDEQSPDKSHEGGTVLGPNEYILTAPMVVRGEECPVGKKVNLTPRQAEFARGQNCID